MRGFTKTCSVCSTEFEPFLSYQMEERVETDQTGRPRIGFAYYCSQRCLQKSQRGGEDGTVSCDSCGARFRPELAAQVVYVRGRRRYACSQQCRARILTEAHGPRLVDTPHPPQPGPAPVPAAAKLPPVFGPQRASARPPAIESGPVVQPDPPPPTGDSASARVLAVFNHKGGTGKTTTAVTLAAGLAERGKRVLLVDTDGQGNVAVSLDLHTERSLYQVLVMGLAFGEAVVNVRPGLDVLPSNETLAAAELYLAGRRHRHQLLAARLAEALPVYDYLIVDCSPSLSLLNQNALVLSSAVLCPVACDYLSLVGVRQVLRTIRQVNKLLGHSIQLWGVLPTMFDSRARICHEAVATLRKHFGDRCLDPVRSTIKVKEAPSQGKTLLEYAPGSNAAIDYLKAVDRILDHCSRFSSAAPGRTAAAGGIG